MGTRATISYKSNGRMKTQYVQYDGYFSGLGTIALEFARKVADGGATMLAAAKASVDALTVVPEDGKPAAKELTALDGAYFEQVSTGTDWYAHLRKCQGNPELTLTSGYITDGSESFRKEEYDYVIDLDAETFTAYRWEDKVVSYGLDALPSVKDFVKLDASED